VLRIDILRPGDEDEFERFLVPLADSSMFLRSNVRAVGFVDDGRPLSGVYAAARCDGRIVGVAGHSWSGNLMLQAPRALPELARAVLAESGRALGGIVGPWSQVTEARDALGLHDRPADLVSRDLLFGLELARLRVPEPLATGRVRLRPATAADAPLLTAWRRAYAVEILGATDSPALAEKSRREVAELSDRGQLFALESADGEILSTTGFNAELPDMVQVGGVYTPPERRCLGHARAAVAGSLLGARDAGVSRAILFTGENNHAQRPYRALGFEQTGDYGLVLFA